MNIGGRQSVSQITRHFNFGGAPRDFVTSNTHHIMPDVGVYRINGTGRDTYIAHDNGGNFLGYHPDL